MLWSRLTSSQQNCVIEKRGFYPDYIVKFTDGWIGIFDTKSGFAINQPETKEKLRALYRYINEHNGGAGLHGVPLKLFGGIIDVRGPDGGPKTFYLQAEPDGEFVQFNEF